jgi:uncharacterized integral membrane protein (TIGR00697 family)
MDTVIKDFLTHGYSPEFLALITLIVGSGALLLLFRLYGALGLFCYAIMAYLATNIQVLQVSNYFFLEEPVALGTVLFATTFLVSDILTEHFGATVARKIVGLSFITQFVFTLLMLITIAHPREGDLAVVNAMELLFLPAPRLFAASLVAYVISQLIDIWIFEKISKQTRKKYLWFRTIVSTSFSALIDSLIFSSLAWVVLNPNPVSLNSLIFTYVLGGLAARVFVAIVSTPVIYLSYYCLPKNAKDRKNQMC